MRWAGAGSNRRPSLFSWIVQNLVALLAVVVAMFAAVYAGRTAHVANEQAGKANQLAMGANKIAKKANELAVEANRHGADAVAVAVKQTSSQLPRPGSLRRRTRSPAAAKNATPNVMMSGGKAAGRAWGTTS